MKNSEWNVKWWGLNDENEVLVEFYKLQPDGYRFRYDQHEKILIFLKHFNRTNAKDAKELHDELSKNDDRFPLLYKDLSDNELRHLINKYSIECVDNLIIVDRLKIKNEWLDFSHKIRLPQQERNNKSKIFRSFKNFIGM